MKKLKLENDFKIINKIINGNVKNYTFNVESLCSMSTFCYDKVNNIILLKFGFTVYKYIEYKRLIKAIFLLNQGEKISFIYREIGYSNAKTFRSAFKKLFNFCPNDFRTFLLK